MSIPSNLKSDVEQTCLELKSINRKISRTLKMEVISKYVAIFFAAVLTVYCLNPIDIFPDTRPTTIILFLIYTIGSGLIWFERGNRAKSFMTDSVNMEDIYLERGFMINKDGTTIYRTDQKGEFIQAFDPFDPASYG